MAKGIGITLPLTKGKTGYFAQAFTIIDQLKSNFINLILTRKGERPMEPDFGCDIHTLMFTQMDSDYEVNVQNAVTSAVSKWMPFLTINDLVVQRDDDHNRTLITTTFSLTSNANIFATVTVLV